MGGQRAATLTAATLSNLVTTDVFAGSLSYSAGAGQSGRLLLEYGATNHLNKNLATEVAFELEINGDMDDGASPRPVVLTVRVESNGRTRQGSAQISLARDGVYQIPFSWFAGVDFADVDYLSFDFDASQVSAIDYGLIGGLRMADCLQTGSVIADIVIDDFIAKLPQSYLPGYGMINSMWVGTFNGTQKVSAQANQSNLVGTLGGQRKTLMERALVRHRACDFGPAHPAVRGGREPEREPEPGSRVRTGAQCRVLPLSQRELRGCGFRRAPLRRQPGAGRRLRLAGGGCAPQPASGERGFAQTGEPPAPKSVSCACPRPCLSIGLRVNTRSCPRSPSSPDGCLACGLQAPRSVGPEAGTAMNDHQVLDAALRLGLAFLLVLPLGWEREQRSRSAGLRTYPLLSVCACGFLLLAQMAPGGPTVQADVFYGLLSGIGFVGSGAIMKSVGGAGSISTAVSLWVTGAIGVGVAYGRPLLSAALSLMSVLALWAPSFVKRSQGAP
jgi:putative Mg2+ transporter-C (MgtC) family protein